MTTSNKNERWPQKNKMEDDLKNKWKMNQSTKINLIGCDTIVNSPSFFFMLIQNHTINIPYKASPLFIQEGQDPIKNHRKVLRSQMEHWGQINIPVGRGQTAKEYVKGFHPLKTKICDDQRPILAYLPVLYPEPNTIVSGRSSASARPSNLSFPNLQNPYIEGETLKIKKNT